MSDPVDDLIAFAATHPWSPTWPPETIRRFCTTLISRPDLILDIKEDGNRLIAGVLLDRIDNPARHAALEILGVNGDAPALVGRLIDLAAARRPGDKIGFDITFAAQFTPPGDWLAAHRLHFEYRLFDMLLTLMPALAQPDPIVKANGEDYAEIYDVMAAAFAANRDTHVPPKDEWLARRDADPSGAILIHREASAIAGYIHYSRGGDTGDTGDISTVGVLPAFRRRGIACALLDAALAQMAADGASSCRLSAAAENEKALTLYRAFGFTVEKTSWVYSRAFDA